jgi:hypothetical protein
MSNSNNAGFGNMIPGFDFLKNLAGQNTNTNSGNPMAAMSQWIAPTLSIEDIDKRIDELKSVQFWLEQNLMGLKATIQALEVQKMTLSTLESMNFSMADMAKAFTPKMSESATPATASNAFTSTTSATKEDADKNAASSAAGETSSESANTETKSIVDPMAWWNGITAQFGQIANATLKDIQEQSEKAAALAQEQAQALAEAALAANSAATTGNAAGQESESAATKTKKPRARKVATANTAPKTPRKTKTTKL